MPTRVFAMAASLNEGAMAAGPPIALRAPDPYLYPSGPPPSWWATSAALALPTPTYIPLARHLGGGPEGKLRGRPPPLVEPRSGPWRRTGSESGAGRAQTRRFEYDEHARGTTTPRES